MDFILERRWNTKKYCGSLWLAAKKGFSILDALEWLKLFLFFLCFSFFFLPHKNVGTHTPRPRPPSGVAGPDYIPKGPYEIKF